MDSLDDLLWAEIFNSNNLRHLVTVSLDQCHSLSGDSLQVPTPHPYFTRKGLRFFVPSCVEKINEIVILPSEQDLIDQENSLQVLNVWCCRFITNKHRDHFRKIVKTENYDLSIRYLHR